MKSRLFVTAILTSHVAFAAQGLQHEDSKKLASELAVTINASLKEIEKIEKQHDVEFNLNGFVLSNHDVLSSSLGLLIDRASNMVLAVTPNLIADNMGVLVGDEITEFIVDNKKILPTDKELSASIKNAKSLTLNLTRNGQNVSLSKEVNHKSRLEWSLDASNKFEDSDVTTTARAGMECGSISQLGYSLRNKYLFATRIIKIDGKNVTNKSHFRLPLGKHTIVLHEAIDDKSLLKFESNTERRNAKAFEVYVEANKNYKIAAKYIKKNERTDDKRKKYWNPVIYKTQDRKCSL